MPLAFSIIGTAIATCSGLFAALLWVRTDEQNPDVSENLGFGVNFGTAVGFLFGLGFAIPIVVSKILAATGTCS